MAGSEGAEHVADGLIRQRPIRRNGLWVSWTKDKASNPTSIYSDHNLSVQDRIKTALIKMNSFTKDMLVQFWAATTMTDEGGRRLLTTSDQPFALFRLNGRLNQYKMNCPSFKLVGGEGDHNITGGSIGRVFQRQLPEMSADISCYSVKEYPERDLALGCGIKATLALPVFEPSLQCCVGVLEFLLTEYTSFAFRPCVDSAIKELQEAGLETTDTKESVKHIIAANIYLVFEEITGAIRQVREKHSLPLAKIWARCGHISSVGHDSDVSCRGELLVSIPNMWVYDDNENIYYDHNLGAFPLSLIVGQGPVGEVFHSDKPCYCRDVTQLSIIDYPLAHFAGKSKFKSCFTVCLQSVATGDRFYAFEFFLPDIHSGDLHNFLSSVLTTLKQHLQSLKVVTGESDEESLMVKGKNVIRAEQAEQGFTSFTHSTLNASSSLETTSSSYTYTDYKTISPLSTPSGHETVSLPSVPLPVAFAYEQISSLTSHVQYIQAELAKFQKLVDEYEASSHQRV